MRVEHRMGPGIRDQTDARRETRLARTAARQHGVVEVSQLRSIGYSASAVSRCVQRGFLNRIYPRVYRVAGSRRTSEQRAMAAALWAGPSAMVSHSTAAQLWGFGHGDTLIHVTSERQLTSPPPGVRAHVSNVLSKRDRGTLRAVPLTSPPRTLLDLAATATASALLPLVERAVLEDIVTPQQLRAAIGRARGRRGCRTLERVLDAGLRDGRWSSALERRVERVLRAAALPIFVREHEVGPFRLDFAWPSRRVGVEADGRRWHSSERDFARDRAKLNLLTTRGWRILRVTWESLPTLADDVQRLLA